MTPKAVGGIINVVTKKKVRGYNAYLNAYYNTNNLYGASANLNIKSGKSGFTAYYGARILQPAWHKLQRNGAVGTYLLYKPVVKRQQLE
jgi:hypothetical protein